jgi:hypothetical protein
MLVGSAKEKGFRVTGAFTREPGEGEHYTDEEGTQRRSCEM